MEQQDQSTIERRLMQVKVLYTFNDDPKSNCLARCPHPLNLQTAHLDSSTEIGVIELRTCIQAIAAASPELVAKLGQDYTVYAYDYSEYETPLVGQGMLSWILASASSTPMAPAYQSRTMVTGRVCKNTLGLFSGGARETLEVRLRLVPVPTCLQSEYLASMEKYRSASTLQADPTDGNHEVTAAWSSLLQTSPSSGPMSLLTPAAPNPIAAHAHPLQQNNPTFRPAPRSRSLNDNPSFDPTHNTLFTDTAPHHQNSPFDHTQSRPTTPSQQQQSSQTNKRGATTSRPSSRNSTRGRPALKQSQSCASRVELSQGDNSEAEDGPRRKRAKVLKADWNGSSTFGMGGDSLRVTAATAASVRGRRQASNLLTSDALSGGPMERPPTPRPRTMVAPTPVPTFPRSLTSTMEELNKHEQKSSQRSHTNDPLGILAESSPEKNGQSSMESSPMDMPSSPPVIRDGSLTPSSPSLPNLRFHDSGFDSGAYDDYMADNEKCDAMTFSGTTSQELELINQSTRPELDLNVDPNTLGRKLIPGPPPLTHVSHTGTVAASSPNHLPRKRPPKSRAHSLSRNSSARTGAGGTEYETQSLEARVAMLSSATPADESRFRSESCLTELGSQADSPLREDDLSGKRAKNVTHEKKKLAIQTRLAESIKAGAMPRFCKNCGEIKTPSWRKAFIRIEKGDPSKVKVSEDESGIHSWEPIERADDGSITAYRVVKKKINNGDTDFEEIELCNPCGIWLFKNKVMRPQGAWDKQNEPKARRKSSSKKRVGEEEDQPLEMAPTEQEHSAGGSTTLATRAEPIEQNLSSSRQAGRHHRANSLGPLECTSTRPKISKRTSAQAALQRAIQSSPPRFPGSKIAPIEIDLDQNLSPKPTKRLLFPSPRKPGEIKSLDPDQDKKMSPLGGKGKHASGLLLHMSEDKENISFGANTYQDVALGQILSDDKDTMMTPKRNILSEGGFQTPSRSNRRTPLSSRHFMSSGTRRRRHSNPATPSRAFAGIPALTSEQMTPFTAHLTQLLSESNGMEGTSLDSYAMDDNGVFNFSDFDNCDTNENLAFFGHDTSATAGFWVDGNAFTDSIEAYLNASQTPRKSTANESRTMSNDGD